MTPKDLRKLAEDPRFISGIYNYCDRWCERCPLTSRCLLFATEKESENDAGHDARSEAFWEQLADIFAQTEQLLLEVAKERGIDLSNVDVEAEALIEERRRRRARAKSKDLSRMAMKYVKVVDSWLKKHRRHFKRKGRELVRAARMELPGQDPEADALAINDAVEVIRWYQHQIYVKLSRAFTSRENEAEMPEEEAEYPSDADGSAKVALIGIDRSIAAWAKLYEHFDKADAILDILVHLERLRRQAEAAFPNARAFKRPGFDD